MIGIVLIVVGIGVGIFGVYGIWRTWDLKPRARRPELAPVLYAQFALFSVMGWGLAVSGWLIRGQLP